MDRQDLRQVDEEGMRPARYPDYPTERIDPPAQRNNWKIATLALIGVLLLGAIGVGMFFLGQSTRMSHGEVVAQEHKLVAAALLQQAGQDALREKQAVGKAVAKQKAHDQRVAKEVAAHAKSEGESSGRSQGEFSGRAQGESSGKAQAESETTKVTGHDSEGYAYGYLPNGGACDDNPRVPLPLCS